MNAAHRFGDPRAGQPPEPTCLLVSGRSLELADAFGAEELDDPGGREATVQELLREQAVLQKALAAAEETWLFACGELERLESDTDEV